MILVHKPENGVECRSEVANKVLLQRHTREREREKEMFIRWYNEWQKERKSKMQKLLL